MWLDDTYLEARQVNIFLVQLLFTLVQCETRRCFYHHGFSIFILECDVAGISMITGGTEIVCMRFLSAVWMLIYWIKT